MKEKEKSLILRVIHFLFQVRGGGARRKGKKKNKKKEKKKSRKTQTSRVCCTNDDAKKKNVGEGSDNGMMMTGRGGDVLNHNHGESGSNLELEGIVIRSSLEDWQGRGCRYQGHKR
jgi:hypothetical protein